MHLVAVPGVRFNFGIHGKYNTARSPDTGSAFTIRAPRKAALMIGNQPVKLKNLIAMAGIRPRPKRYGFEITSHQLDRDGTVQFAQWLHPKEGGKHFTQSAVDELRRFVSPGDVAIDIGAHSGDTALPIALAVGKEGRVFALEPNGYVFPVLEKNSTLNPDKTSIIPLKFAAAPKDMELTFEYSDAGYCNGGRHHGVGKWKHGHVFPLKVSGRNLEEYLRAHYPGDMQRIRFIKIDVEGAEIEVLKVLAGLIDTARPYVRAEVYKHSPDAIRRQLITFFLDRGYIVHKINGDEEYLGEPVDQDRVSNWEHYDILAVPPGVVPRTRP